jgi:N12 class adenine-specific DNA methylase
MQDDPELARRIEKIYNDKFNALVPMEVGEEFLPERFEGANTGITLRPHQKLGAIKGLISPTMLAHEVGTCKSFTLITTAMEMRRLGTAKKPMIVVQNATVAQLTADAKLLYPNAKVLSLSEQDRDAEGRRAFYAKIKYNDWDIIIVPQSTFERIPDSPERELQFIQEKIDEKKHVIEAAQAAGVDARDLDKLKRELEKIEQEYGDRSLDSDPANASNEPKRKKKDAKREAASLDKAETRAK